MTGADAEPVVLRREQDGPLAVLTMDSPPQNLFDERMWRQWAAALDRLTAEPPRALLIRAAGRVVSAGVDVRVFAESTDPAALWADHLRITRALEALPCPVVFAAHSMTLTAAFELALACDLIVATPQARFGLVENRIAFTPAMGGTQRLARRAGAGRAAALVMSGDLYRGSKLADWGVVDELFEAATFAADSYAYAQRLAAGPSRAHAGTKRILRAYATGGVDAADAIVPEVAAAVAGTDDHRRAVAAFLRDGPGHRTGYENR